jgi:ferredoxin
LQKSELPRLVDFLMRSYRVLAPRRKGKHFVFDAIGECHEPVLDYTATILPPKKFFQPPVEELFSFDRTTNRATPPRLATGPQVLLGVHPCDMAAILRLDWAFTQGQPEANWVERRKATLIFGVTQKTDDQVFSVCAEANDPERGFDAFFFRHGPNYVVCLYTPAAEKALSGFGGLQPAAAAEVAAGRADFDREAKAQRKRLNLPVSALPLLLKGTERHPEWTSVAERCLSCGQCTIVCPTCYCFDVQDQLDLGLTTGRRERQWDSCQLHDFTSVAGTHTFREKRENRAKHRIYRKFKYQVKDGDWASFCVGCGRCIRACPAKIDLVDVCNNINAGS